MAKCFSLLAALALLVSAAQCLNILITNDDGFGSANMRELYHQMVSLGHNCWIVASATQQSGQGGRHQFDTNANLTQDSQFGLIKAGAPSLGPDPFDSHIWYYNGTPAVQVLVALDYVLPTFANFSTPDLVLSGPNFGLNVSPADYTGSGTVGATYTAVMRGIPAIAFSAGYDVLTSYQWVNSSTKVGLQDPATIVARLSANLAQAVIDKATDGPILPKGYGISVNLPYITSYTNDSCVNPPFVLSRMTGDATMNEAVYNSSTGVFTPRDIAPVPGGDVCINGNCNLPSESELLQGCNSSVTVFTVDYDAPYKYQCDNATSVVTIVPGIVYINGTTTLVPGLGENGTVTGTPSSNTSTPATPSAAPPQVTAVTSGAQAQGFKGLRPPLAGLAVAVAWAL